MLPPFGCKNWKPVAALKPSEGQTQPLSEAQRNALSGFFERGVTTEQAIARVLDAVPSEGGTEPAAQESYAQREANRTGKPYYVGPDNVRGGSHWVYPQAAPEGLEQQPEVVPDDLDKCLDLLLSTENFDNAAGYRRARNDLAQFIHSRERAALAESEGRVAKAREELTTALNELQVDPHMWSQRPCSTCTKVTLALGKPFGCILFAQVRALRLTAPGRETK